MVDNDALVDCAFTLGQRVMVVVQIDKPWSYDWQHDTFYVAGIHFNKGEIDITLSCNWPPEPGTTDGFKPEDLAALRTPTPQAGDEERCNRPSCRGERARQGTPPMTNPTPEQMALAERACDLCGVTPYSTFRAFGVQIALAAIVETSERAAKIVCSTPIPNPGGYSCSLDAARWVNMNTNAVIAALERGDHLKEQP